jgi:hypothetical protein
LTDAAGRWTPAVVADRIEEALRIAVKTGGRVGPRAFATAWPEYRSEFSDKTHRSLEEWMDEIEATGARRFSAAELSRADEALAWPIELISHPLMRDAVWLVSLARVHPGVEVKHVLARRRKRADAMVEKRKLGDWYTRVDSSAKDIVRIYEDDAEEVAARVATWANDAMAKPLRVDQLPRRRKRRGDPRLTDEEYARVVEAARVKRNLRVRSGAKVLFARGVKEFQVIERVVFVKRADVMPGRVFNFAPCYRWFDRGLTAISTALSAREAPVR